MSLAPVETMQPILNASHRCDRCGSRAYVCTVLRRTPALVHGGELLWCQHHFREHAESLMPYLSAIVDETSQLTRHIADDHHVN